MILVFVVLAGAFMLSCTADPREGESEYFSHPQRVTIVGYEDQAMEPFLTRDGRTLLFNNLNVAPVNTNILYAERVDDLTFQYRGEVGGVNTAALEGVPSVDRSNTIYFVSTRSFETTFSTIYRGVFFEGAVSSVELVPGVSRVEPQMVNFDVEVSPDGETLYFVDARFGSSGPETADIVVAVRQGAAFARLANSAEIMQNVNADTLEYAPCISADGLTLLFTRAGQGLSGNASIYISQRGRKGDPFGPPMRLAALDGFVEGPALSPDESALYFHKREGTRFVIFRASR